MSFKKTKDLLFICSLVGFVANLTGCDQVFDPNKESGSEAETTEAPISAEQNAQEPDFGDHWNILDVFEITLDASENLRLNEEFTVDYTIHAHYPVDDAQITGTSPELELMAKNYFDSDIGLMRPTGKKLGGLQNETIDLVAGERHKSSVTVSFDQPGYYSFTVRATTEFKEESGLSKDSKLLNNHASETIWIYVDEDEAHITDNFKIEKIDERYQTQPGPFIKREPNRAYAQNPDDSNSLDKGDAMQDDLSPSTSHGATAVVTFEDQTDYNIKPLEGVEVETIIYDQQFGEVVGGGSTYTDENGEASIGCYNPNQPYYEYQITVYAKNNDDAYVTTDNGNDEISYGTNPTCGQDFPMSGQDDLATTFYRMAQAQEYSEQHFNRSRDRLSVMIEYDYGDDTSRYDSNTDQIYIIESHMGGTIGEFIAGHEFGHAYDEKALAGIHGGSQCGDDREGIDSATNLECGYVEGIATYISTVIFDNLFRTNIDNNVYYPATSGDGNPDDGSINEGAVASFLYNMTGPVDNSHDGLEYPGSYIGDLIATCEIKWNDWWVRAEGIDHIIACAQEQIPDYTIYFPDRSYGIIDRNDGASNPSDWDSNDIENLWKDKLYDNWY